MRAHIIREGEYLTQIAARLGARPEDLWNHPKNAELRAKREHMDILRAGDILFLPDEPPRVPLTLKKGTANRYTVTLPKVKLSLVLRDGDVPLPNEPFVIKGAGALIEGTTDASGRLTVDISVRVREGEILLPKQGLSFPLHIGNMDPVREDSGVQKRLENLGFYSAPSSADEDAAAAALKAAVIAFQSAHQLEANGTIDDEFRQLLTREHGC